MAEDRIIVALDVESRREALSLCALLSGKVRTVKVGLQLFVSEGPAIISEIHELGFDVFLDLKLHDIPHQVGMACAEIVAMGVAMFTVHAQGGISMLRQAVDATHAAARACRVAAPKIVAVTLLTSLDQQALHAIGIARGIDEQVVELGRLAMDCGVDGVVASAREVRNLRHLLGDEFIAVTPGIRDATATTDDQRRTATPAEALAAGATYLVLGRPITAADDPAATLAGIIEQLD